MSEVRTFELCAQLMMAESRAAEQSLRARMAQEFFQAMLGVYLDLDQSYAAWQGITRRWEEEKSKQGRSAPFRKVLLDYFLESQHLSDPIITEFSELQRLRFSSSTDHLTGTLNRRFFDALLAKEVPRAARYGEDLCLVLIDVNRFKEVNDTRGHAFGDQLLAMAGTVLNDSLRVSDSAFRVGGDEFALLLPQATHPGAVALAERVREVFARQAAGLGLEIPVSLAYGVASCPREAVEPKALFALADQRLYEFKRAIGSPRCVPRNYKRIPTEELGAYVDLRVGDRVCHGSLLDFSFGGLGFRVEEQFALPDLFYGDLHLPVLPSVSVALRKVYARPDDSKGQRIGCAFVETVGAASP